MNDPKEKFRLLAQRLAACPARDNRISKKLLSELWRSLQKLDPEHGDEITPAIIAAVILFDAESFGSLLNEAELIQLRSSACLALERCQLKINPPDQADPLLAASLKP